MKKLVVVLGLLCLLCPVCRAAEYEPELDELWRAGEAYGVERGTELDEGLEGLVDTVLTQSKEYLCRSLQAGTKLMAVVLLCGFAQSAGLAPSAMTAVRMAGALSVTLLSVNDVESMVGLGRETVEKMDVFSAILLPAMAVLTAATGHINGAAARQGITMLFGRGLLSLMDGLLIPLVYAYVAACCACAAAGNDGLKKIAAMLKGVVTTVLTMTLLIFVGYLTASGAISGSADAAAIKATKIAVSRAVPVVGSILADAAESILVGAGIVKGTAGVVGLLVVLSICLGPFVQLAFHYIVYKATAALTAAVAPPQLSGLLDQIAGAFGLVLGMTGASAMLMLFSLVSALKVVTS